MQSRDSGPWWADQEGTAWSAYSLWKLGSRGQLRLCLRDDSAGVLVCRWSDGDLVHLIRIPPPDATPDASEAFYTAWEQAGRPP